MTNFEDLITFTLPLLRNFWAFALKYLLWFVLFTAPVHQFFITIFVMIFFDLITGIIKAVKIGEPITSKRMRQTVTKLLSYTTLVFLSFMVDYSLIADTAVVLSKVVGGFIILIEFQSNVENISAITGVNFWLAIKDKVMAYLNNKVLADTNKKEDENI